ncbi:MAG: hypothetical protein ABSG46_02765 [Candidatus Binataceae bacterium]|jgi:hypothetical protein
MPTHNSKITIPPLRLLFGEGFVPPGLPCSFALAPFYGPGADNGPAKLEVMPTGGWLDGSFVPESILNYQQSFLQNWTDNPSYLSNQQSADEQFGGGQLSLSWYSGNRSANAFGTIQPTEDRKKLLGIAGSRDQTGAVTLAFTKGTLSAEKPALAIAPVATVPLSAPDIHELLTLEFPGLSDATCDAMGDQFNWALDEQWRSKLVAKTRFEPLMPSASPSSKVIDGDRVQMLDDAAEWYNVTFGPAVLGGQLWSEAQPGPNNKKPLNLTKRLTGNQPELLDNYRKNILVKSGVFQHQNALATGSAHFTVQPRLALYLGKAQDFYNLLTANTEDRPSIVQFIADASADPDFQDAALRLSGRYAGLLGALDRTGELEQEFRLDLVAAQMAMMTFNCKFDNANDIAEVLTLGLQQLQQTPAGNEILLGLELGGTIAGKIPGLAQAIAKELANTAPPPGPKPPVASSALQKAFMARLNTVKTNLLKVPGVQLGADAAPTLLLAASFGYSIYQSICAMMNVKNLTPAQAASTIANTVQSVFQGIKKSGDIYKGALALIKGGLSDAEKAAYEAALKASMLVSKSELGAVVKDGLKLAGTSENIFLKAGSWFESVVKLGGRFDGEGMTMDLFFDGADLIGKALGPLVAAAALAQAVVSLVRAIIGGASSIQIGEDAFNTAAAAACLILAVLALSASCGPALIVGIVIAVVVAIVDFILSLFMRRRKPESPPDDYMEHVVIPFVGALPSPAAESPALPAHPAAAPPPTHPVAAPAPPHPAAAPPPTHPVAAPAPAPHAFSPARVTTPPHTRVSYPSPAQARLRGRVFGPAGVTA